ncbi:YraN family protein [Quadrisphaera setariae]|uniref:YraN family protein n=1 Tax=Quadrisphaera setariae TaxID=2593304 RepID=UPI00210670E4|nr:YraN family protein [Quadrisphaera setariae]
MDGRGTAQVPGAVGALTRREVGAHGERVAEAHLVAAGAEVLDRNWRCRWGELDLVVRDGDALVGVEVRTRRTTAAGTPLESVTPLKVARLRRLLGLWCADHPARARAGRLRLDVVGVLLDAGGRASVQHVRGVEGA